MKILKQATYGIFAVFMLLLNLIEFVVGLLEAWGLFAFWTFPITFCFLIIFLKSIDSISFFTWLVMTFIEISLQSIAFLIFDKKVIKETFDDFLSKYSTFFFEPRKITILPVFEKIYEKLGFYRFLFYRPQMVRIFYVWSYYDNDLMPPTSLNTRQFFSGKSWIFVPQDPNKIKGLGRFKLFHEIGHSSIMHKYYYVKLSHILYCLLCLILFYIFQNEVYSLKTFFLALSIILLIFFLALRKKNEEIDNELFADKYAFLCVSGEDNFDKIKQSVINEYKRDGKEMYAEKLSKDVTVLEEAIQTDDPNKIYTYFADLFSHTPPRLLTLFISFSIIYAGLNSNFITWENLKIYCITALIFFVLLAFFHINNLLYLKSFYHFVLVRQSTKSYITEKDCY